MSTQELATFLARLQFSGLPEEPVLRTKECFLDWIGSALAGKNAKAVTILEDFAQAMGPKRGTSEILVSRRPTSPFFAALVNAASSHVVEQDDLHNLSVLHPATVVFPAALAAAQDTGASGRDFLTAVVAGYEAGVRAGEFLGRSHYKVFHTTGTAGTLAAAAAAGHLLKLRPDAMLHTLGSAGTQAAGLWEFLRDGADSKQLHTAKAAANGLMSAYLSRRGFTGAKKILEGDQGMGAGMSSDPKPEKLAEGLGLRWGICDTSLKFHASCRHTHPSADALLLIIRKNRVDPTQIEKIDARVYQAAVDVLGPVTDPQTIHQSKFCMGFVLALIAQEGSAGISDFTETALRDPGLRSLSKRVHMSVDPAIDAAYPQRWGARVEVEMKDGRLFSEPIQIPKGDPENRLSRTEIEDKAVRLATYQNGATEEEMRQLIERIWRMEEIPRMETLLPPG